MTTYPQLDLGPLAKPLLTGVGGAQCRRIQACVLLDGHVLVAHHLTGSRAGLQVGRAHPAPSFPEGCQGRQPHPPTPASLGPSGGREPRDPSAAILTAGARLRALRCSAREQPLCTASKPAAPRSDLFPAVLLQQLAGPPSHPALWLRPSPTGSRPSASPGRTLCLSEPRPTEASPCGPCACRSHAPRKPHPAWLPPACSPCTCPTRASSRPPPLQPPDFVRPSAEARALSRLSCTFQGSSSTPWVPVPALLCLQ